MGDIYCRHDYHLTGQSDSISRVVYIDFTEMEYVNIAFVPVVTVSTFKNINSDS